MKLEHPSDREYRNLFHMFELKQKRIHVRPSTKTSLRFTLITYELSPGSVGSR